MPRISPRAQATGTLVVILAFWALLAGVAMFGCAHVPSATVSTTVTHSLVSHPGTTPPELHQAASGFTWIAVLCVVPIGVGIGLYFFAPATHAWSLILAGVAGATEATALLLRISLWFIPWLAIALLVFALGVLAYELWRKRSSIESAVDGLLSDAKTAFSAVDAKV